MGTDLVVTLRARDVIVTTVRDAGLIQKTDEVQLAFATNQASVLYSFNICDFYRIHTLWARTGREHAGIILAPQQRYSIGEQARRILLIRSVRIDDAMRNNVEFLANWER